LRCRDLGFHRHKCHSPHHLENIDQRACGGRRQVERRHFALGFGDLGPHELLVGPLPSRAPLTSRASSVSCSDGIVGSARARDIAVISEDCDTRPGQEAYPGPAAGVLGLRPHVAFYRGHKCRADRIHQRAQAKKLITIAADRERLGAQIGITDQPRPGSVLCYSLP